MSRLQCIIILKCIIEAIQKKNCIHVSRLQKWVLVLKNWKFLWKKEWIRIEKLVLDKYMILISAV